MHVLSRVDPDHLLRHLEDNQKLKYSIKTVKLLQATLVELIT